MKSRQLEFYYGNKQNRFWRFICGYFGENVPETTAEKKDFLTKRGVALWDIVTACEIDGSSDTSIKNAKIADLREVLRYAKIEKILLNGATAYRLFVEHYGDLSVPYEKMPSTSPANPRFDESVWKKALDKVFKIR